MARDGIWDREGKWAGHVEGVWGGYLWRHGQKIDPFGTDYGNMRSVYYLVWYDKHRGSWRAEVVVKGVRYYIAQTKNEDEAGRAAYEFLKGLDPDANSPVCSGCGSDCPGERGTGHAECPPGGRVPSGESGHLALQSQAHSTVQGGR
jgi:hypothetical protein